MDYAFHETSLNEADFDRRAVLQVVPYIGGVAVRLRMPHLNHWSVVMPSWKI